jgi:hypothetical protein
MFNQFARREDSFRDWRRGGMPGLTADSCKYIEFLTWRERRTRRCRRRSAARLIGDRSVMKGRGEEKRPWRKTQEHENWTKLHLLGRPRG